MKQVQLITVDRSEQFIARLRVLECPTSGCGKNVFEYDGKEAIYKCTGCGIEFKVI